MLHTESVESLSASCFQHPAEMDREWRNVVGMTVGKVAHACQDMGWDLIFLWETHH